MQVCLRGCLTDLVSKSGVGQNVNQSRMEQMKEMEWLSNHPNHFFSFSLFSCCMLQLCCFSGPARKCWRRSVWGGGRVKSPCCWPLGWEGSWEERHSAHCDSSIYWVLISLLAEPFISNIWFGQSAPARTLFIWNTVLPFWTLSNTEPPLSHMFPCAHRRA